MKALIPSIISLGFLYLLGAFVETSFDISLWRQGVREGVALFAPVFAIMGFAIRMQGDNND